MASNLEPSISDMDESIMALLKKRTQLLLQLEDLNKKINSALLAREHLEIAADDEATPEA